MIPQVILRVRSMNANFHEQVQSERRRRPGRQQAMIEQQWVSYYLCIYYLLERARHLKFPIEFYKMLYRKREKREKREIYFF